jgi:hypothetical protein
VSVFSVLNTGTISIVRNVPTADEMGGPLDGFFDDANVVERDLPAQVDYHRDRLLGNVVMPWAQEADLGQRDIWVDGTFAYLGDTGNGYGVIFEGTRFGRITAIERDQALGDMPGSSMLIVKVVGV